MAEKVLSIFIDESGHFGPYEKHNPYYLVSMVAHEQSVDISDEIAKMDHYIIQNGRPINKMVQSKEVMERNIHACDEDVKWQLAEPGR